ncbi:MAG: sugar phosphate isomerase/epimerase family protein [Armatimonadota bacterium]|nr:sugar phosphate isomerase/epimerase family protein [Armatimonadota bacterium]
MLDKFKLGACLPTFGSCADRYCLSGYGKGGKTVEEMMSMARQVEDLDGLELVGNWHVNDDNIDYMKKLFADNNLAICMVVPDLWTQEKWGAGSLASTDASVRKDAVREVAKSMDWAAGVGCAYVDVWPGQDGFDYPLQADFTEAWKRLRDGVAECAAYRSDVKVLVEYKLKEPRTHCYVNSAAKTILLLDGIDNTGCLLDIGHSMAAGENVAEAAALLAEFGILDYLHLNDNYRTWDDDMLVASVNIPETLEFVYWLRRLRYSGWLTLDIFPYREEKLPAVRNCFAWMKALLNAVDRTGLDKIGAVIETGDANEAVRLVREMLTGK